ncbi:MAG TPA: hypothetical protein VGC79_06270 [Polyangiaceae bacterium]
MKHLNLIGTSLAVMLLALSCSSDDTTNNGVPNPEGGAGGAAGHTAGSGGKPASNAGSAGKSGSPAASGGSDSAGAGDLDSAGAAGEAGAAGAPNGEITPFDGSCATLPGKVVYIESGDTQENLLKYLGRHLRDTSNINIAFNLTGSCTLTNDIYTNAKVVPNGTLKYIPSTAEAPDWTVAQAEPTCTTGPEGVPVDLAISALFVESCGLGGPPSGSNLDLIQGPIQAYAFVVPNASSQTAIGSDEAYYTFGFGDENPLSPTYDPWNNHNFMFIRPTTKSTLVAIAKNIGVPPAKWKGIAENASSDVVSAVAGSSSPEATIGILGTEVYDAKRTSAGIKTLAFQAVGQQGAFFPDSNSAAFDKQNLRDGHYTLWSSTVYITPVTAAHVPANPAVKYIEDLVLGNPVSAPPSGGTVFEALADVIQVGLIPECAMKVTRAADGGELSVYTPEAPCTCFYLSKIPGASGTPAGCTACTSSASCAGGDCIHGFCEPDAVSTTGSTVPGCVSTASASYSDIINQCTNAQAIQKSVVLPNPKVALP